MTILHIFLLLSDDIENFLVPRSGIIMAPKLYLDQGESGLDIRVKFDFGLLPERPARNGGLRLGRWRVLLL